MKTSPTTVLPKIYEDLKDNFFSLTYVILSVRVRWQNINFTIKLKI